MQNKFLYKLRLIFATCILFLALSAVWGLYYKIKIFNIQFIPLFQKVFIDFSILTLILTLLIVLCALIFGRIHCSMFCPLGFLQEVVGDLRKAKNSYEKKSVIKYFLATIIFGTMAGGTITVARYFSPYAYFSSAFTISVAGLISIVVILALSIYKSRFFCTHVCPVGTLLGLISKNAYFKININQDICKSCGLCEKACIASCINSKEKAVDNEHCVKCLKCLTACPQEGITYAHNVKKVNFNFSRRNFLIAGGLLLAFSGAVKAGIEIKDKIAEKIKDVILPAGAGSEKRILNTCLNCNLCVQNCPNKIIEKADGNFGAVYLNYEKGCCDYNCNKCSEICPVGAIKKISLKEKQETRIAIAIADKKICTNCKNCKEVCPTHAIIEDMNNVSINSSKCIGCGACKHKCPAGAIKVFAVKEQKTI